MSSKISAASQTMSRLPLAIWRMELPCETIEPHQILRIELPRHARLGWSTDSWKSIHEIVTTDQGPECHVAELETALLPEGTSILFTVFWVDKQSWEGRDFRVRVGTC